LPATDQAGWKPALREESIMTKLLAFVALITLITAVMVSPTVAWVAAVLLALIGVGWAVPHFFMLHVAELTAVVVTDQAEQRFARFLPPGRHWLRPFEQPTATISLSSQTATGKAVGIQTSGGLPLTITWSVSYKLEPLRVQPDRQVKAARTLPQKSAVAVQKHMANILQHIVGEMTLEAMCRPGSHQQLERLVRQQLAARLDEMGFHFSRVMIGPVEMPPRVQDALAAAHECRLQTELEASALTRLHEAIRQFSDKDMARLLELERIYAPGQREWVAIYEPQPMPNRPVAPPQWYGANGRHSSRLQKSTRLL
jgi:hypothetical protein